MTNKQLYMQASRSRVSAVLADPDLKKALKDTLFAQGLVLLYHEFRAARGLVKFVPRTPQQMVVEMLTQFTVDYILTKVFRKMGLLDD